MVVYAGALTQEVEAPMPDENPTPDPAGEQDASEREVLYIDLSSGRVVGW